MKILAFAGSNSTTSINEKLVRHTLTLFPQCEVEFLNLNDFEMPIYSPERQEKGFPEAANRFIQAIDNADAIVCSFAEYNGSYATAFKNLFDWSSRVRMEVFAKKPMLLMATSPGGFGGANVLNAAKASFPFFGADIVETFSLPKFHENFEDGKGIVNAELSNELKSKVAKLIEKLS